MPNFVTALYSAFWDSFLYVYIADFCFINCCKSTMNWLSIDVSGTFLIVCASANSSVLEPIFNFFFSCCTKADSNRSAPTTPFSKYLVRVYTVFSLIFLLLLILALSFLALCWFSSKTSSEGKRRNSTTSPWKELYFRESSARLPGPLPACTCIYSRLLRIYSRLLLL